MPDDRAGSVLVIAEPMILRRDAVGVEPLYYALSADGRQLAWARLLPPLLDVPWVDKSVDWEGLLDIVAAAPEFDPERTCFAGVRQVPPGHRLDWTPGRWRLAREWHPERFLWDGGPAPADASAEFAERLQKAVVDLAPDGATVLLSGGLDSTAIAAAAVRAALPVQALSSVFPRFPSVDETDRILAVREALRIDGELVEVEDCGIDQLEAELTVHGQPHVAPNHGHFSALLRAAAARGKGLLLDGHDGDGALGLMPGLGPLFLRRPRLAKQTLDYLVSAGSTRQAAVGKWVAECLPVPVYMGVHRVLRARRTPTPAWMGPDLHARATPKRTRDRWRRTQLDAVGPRLGRGFAIMGHGAHAAGVELRHPFGDRELLEFLLSLPPEAKHTGGRWKGLVRDGFPELPSVVRDNPRKTIFDEAVEAVHPLSRMREELSDPPVPVPGVDYDALRARLDSGRAYELGEVAPMRRLALSHRFLEARG